VVAVVQRVSAPALVPRPLTAPAQESALAQQRRAAVSVAPVPHSAAPVMADLHSLPVVPATAPGRRVVLAPAVYQSVAAVRSPQSAAVRLASTLPPEQQ
jgi:hypothetical protein